MIKAVQAQSRAVDKATERLQPRFEMDAFMERVEWLRRSHEWEPDSDKVEVVQTHISVVLLGKNRVLKLKKPVDFGFLDYRTLEDRRRACLAEVSLNRRLCPDVYLGVYPIAGPGRPGHVVDYGVLMKKLSHDRMLDRMVARNEVTESDITSVAERLLSFHRAARRGEEVDRYGRLRVIKNNWIENFSQVRPFVGWSITGEEFQSIRRRVTRWMVDLSQTFEDRVKAGLICEGHGDVRCESICIEDGIQIFDCIEFNERFRCSDPAAEVAFLAMDLEARGRPDLGYLFAERYCELAGDADLFRLLPFYRCYRAFVRGKVLSFRLNEPEFSRQARIEAQSRAHAYFGLARRYADPLVRPTVIAVCGPSGSGKTSIARAIAGELGLRVVSSDRMRKLHEIDTGEPRGYGRGAYSEAANRRTYRSLICEAATVLREEGGVVVDATFRRAADRTALREMAVMAGARWRIVECVLDPGLIRERLERRLALGNGDSEATWATYLRQVQEFDEIEPSREHLKLNTAANLAVTSRSATGWLRAADRESL